MNRFDGSLSPVTAIDDAQSALIPAGHLSDKSHWKYTGQFADIINRKQGLV